MRLDLHTHSTASDGTLSPRDLVARAAARGASVLALTDHDSMEGVAEATAAARSAGIALVPGVELSAGPVDGCDVHILGYFADALNVDLQSTLLVLREARLARATAMVESLRAAGFSITLPEVLRSADRGAVGRSHVARVLVGAGYAATVDEAFSRYLNPGQPFYHAKPTTDPASTIRALAATGALPVLAHPGLCPAESLVAELIEAGLAGIEAFHPDHSAEQCAHYVRLAQKHGLLITGGSDFHGPDASGADVASMSLPDYIWPELLASAPPTYRQA